MSIKENIEIVRKNIAEASISSGRKPEDIVLIAVSKTQNKDAVNEALAAGIDNLGENKVQEAKIKFPLLAPNNAKFHMLGHLQTNKVRDAVRLFNMIQSVDSERLITEIYKEAKKNNKVMDVLIEVNIGGEETKSGMKPEEAGNFLKTAGQYQDVNITGLMAIAPYADDPEQARPYFKKMKALFEEMKKIRVQNVKMEHLSMGMSGDYKVAIQEGSTMVRVGTAIFGHRQYN